jgi:hypothetical protein
MVLDYSSLSGKNLPIVQASRMGSIEMVQEMLARGAEVNSTIFIAEQSHEFYINSRELLPLGTFPLLAAVFGGHLDMCVLLVGQGAIIDKPLCLPVQSKEGSKICKKDGYTALLLAVERGEIDIVKFLLSQNADITHRSVNGNTVFILAQKKQDSVMLNLLENFAREHEMDEKTLNSLKEIPAHFSQFEINNHRYYAVLSGVDAQGERYFFDMNSELNSNAGMLFFLNDAGSLEELSKSILSEYNYTFNLGVVQKDFLTLELGRFMLEVPQDKVKQQSTIVLFELVNPSKVSELLGKIKGVPKIIVLSSREVKPLLLENNVLMKVRGGKISKLALMILNAIATMGETTRPFKEDEQAILESQYQADYRKQYDLTRAAKMGSIPDIQRLLLEGVLANEKTFSVGMPKEHLTPFGVSIFNQKYDCALFILNSVLAVEDDLEKFLLDDNSLVVEEIVCAGQFEIYKILHEKGEINTDFHAYRYLGTLCGTLYAELFKYILDYARLKIFNFQESADGWLDSMHGCNKPISFEIILVLVKCASQIAINNFFSRMVEQSTGRRSWVGIAHKSNDGFSINLSPKELILCFVSNQAKELFLMPYLRALIQSNNFLPFKDLIYDLCGKDEVIKSNLQVLIEVASEQAEVLNFLNAWKKGTVEFLVPAILPSQQSSSSASTSNSITASVGGTLETNKGFENNLVN